MNISDTSMDVHRAAGRWCVSVGKEFSINEATRSIVLSKRDFQGSLDAMLAWANVPPTNHGKFFIDSKGLSKKQKTLAEQLDGRFVLVIG